MKIKQNLCYKSTALKLLGLPDAKFKLLGIEPVKAVTNPHYRSGAVAYLYDKDEILALAGTSKVEALKAEPRKPKDYVSLFSRRYTREVEALVGACHALFNLNRYCKRAGCSRKNQNEIYWLKNQFIKLLYKSGHCSSAHNHERKRLI